MSELMDEAVIRMPYEMAMSDELARKQFYGRANALLSELQQLRAYKAERDGQEPSEETLERWLHEFAAWFFNIDSGLLSAYSRERGCWLSPDIQKRWESYAADRKALYKSMRLAEHPIPSDRVADEARAREIFEEMALIADDEKCISILAAALGSKADRITEQDAREIANNIFGYVGISNLTAAFENWFGQFGGSKLLDKLNADREPVWEANENTDPHGLTMELGLNQVPAVSVPDGWKLVPEWPTKEQKDAGTSNKVFAGIDVDGDRRYVHVTHTEVQDIYERMLSAAPPAMLSASPAPTDSRSPQDYAIEHAEYMAVNGEHLIEYLNEISDVDEGVLVPDDRFGDYVSGLCSGIYEFRKRAARCQVLESPAPEKQTRSQLPEGVTRSVNAATRQAKAVPDSEGENANV